MQSVENVLSVFLLSLKKNKSSNPELYLTAIAAQLIRRDFFCPEFLAAGRDTPIWVLCISPSRNGLVEIIRHRAEVLGDCFGVSAKKYPNYFFFRSLYSKGICRLNLNIFCFLLRCISVLRPLYWALPFRFCDRILIYED